MPVNLLQQVGHNQNWNVETFKAGFTGGLILSPVNQTPSVIDGLSKDVKGASIFDPQFYLPNSQKKKLREYPFFPETIASGFQTIAYGTHASQAASLCVQYQKANGFKKIVIPTRFYEEMYPDLTDYHDKFSVLPFVDALSSEKDRPVVLSLVLTSAMVSHEKYREYILNWITSYPIIDEIYLIYSVEREHKQITSAETVFSLLSFGQEIVKTGLGLTLGYQNCENVLFLSLPGVICTAGTFENTRRFSAERFVDSEEERRAPKPRIYLPGLMNWVQYEQAKQIRSRSAAVWDKVYMPTAHSEAVFGRLVDPYFNQPELYKHYIECAHSHFVNLGSLDPTEINVRLKEWMGLAMANHDEVRAAGIVLDPHGDGRHLPGWLKAFDAFVGT